MSELKQCPYCGGNARIDFDQGDVFPYSVRCGDPFCVGNHDSWFEDPESAIAAWNRRADGWIPVSDLRKLVERWRRMASSETHYTACRICADELEALCKRDADA